MGEGQGTGTWGRLGRLMLQQRQHMNQNPPAPVLVFPGSWDVTCWADLK